MRFRGDPVECVGSEDETLELFDLGLVLGWMHGENVQKNPKSPAFVSQCRVCEKYAE